MSDGKQSNCLSFPALKSAISSTEEIIEEARKGRMFILVDDEDRENEGDLIIPAQFATADAINFMARYARGLICLALTPHRVEQLGLPPMASRNGGQFETAFTVSIEARTGVTTGISAADRAHTVAIAINPETGPADITMPGHVFPLCARDGGTLIRAGHTEAAVDVSRMAGLNPSGVICEIMNEDGSMARLPDLVAFAQLHNLKLGTIADLIAYRRKTERLVEQVAESGLHHPSFGEWRLLVYRDRVENGEHIVLCKGDLSDPEPLLVRMHATDFITDALGGSGGVLNKAMHRITRESRGLVVLINDPRPNAISSRVSTVSPHRRPDPRQRDYGIGAQILTDLGVRDMILLSDRTTTLVGLDGYGLNVINPDQDNQTPPQPRQEPVTAEAPEESVPTQSEEANQLAQKKG
ncbi:Riboflavin biosynthesis protein RibBA [Methyloligella halotolerans]|uniref:3,4-dihydroxy-2-butanone 4-phosphate synthase n=1 Tax=Methyloligella halotolerans TaxID=1177755 RepID=A0A1E2S007_9HYPH|nr:3,4-dihydroxy-2-butanone-4-phosphate synthase [Methyloligella halotolerans]ODA67740.1 Riboflavin biosynthesis protein RibBA [Methyloligella halotolerans]